MAGRRTAKRYEVTLSADSRAMVAAVPTSRIKMMATIVGITLAIAPAPWAFKTSDSAREQNGTKPVGTHERIEIIPGVALASRDGQPRPAAYVNGQKVEVDLGELRAGSSQSFPDLLRVRNRGTTPLLVYVEPEKIGSAPTHASVSGDRAPGALWIEPGQERPVDLGVAADLIAPPGDVDGALVVRTASGLVRESVPAKVTVTAPAEESVLAALLAAAGMTNPDSGGFGKLGDAAAGLEKPDFEVEGVWDGGIFATDVRFTWKPVGPLVGARATLDGRSIGRSATVGSEGDHVLKLEASIMGATPMQREIRFRIDRTPPEVLLVAPAITFGNPASFSVSVQDASPVAGVEVLLLKRTEQPAASPTPAPTATPKPSATPTPKASGSPSPSPEGSETPAPSATPKPSATPTPTPSAKAAAKTPEPQPIRVVATYDQRSGTWVAQVQLEPGTYDVWAEAVDVVGNRGASGRQAVEVLRLPVPGV